MPNLRALQGSAVLAAVFTLAACATPPSATPPAPASVTASLESLLADAAKARMDGSRTTERELYRTAAAAYPTRKEPWLRLADSYFDSADYGNAILAAQEVLQRDAADAVASSMLAVSGLRVSTTALGNLRQQKSLGPDTRKQAEEVVRSLREVLGEPVLVPKVADTQAPAEAQRAPARRVVPPRAVVAAPAATPVAPAAAVPAVKGAAAVNPAPAAVRPPTPAPAPAAAPKPATPPASGNPFDRLR